ncbi:hypothetical protein HDU67_009667 [Dinochytrium kinnereticum]|nr:hypothetical protein HDU67_009667 [Dinochytrium kinnereticum]
MDSQSTTPTWATLPTPITTLILTFLTARDLLTLTQVSRSFQLLASQPQLWHRLCEIEKLSVVSEMQLTHLSERCEGAFKNLWKEVWRDSVMVRRNWASGRCKTSFVEVLDVRDSVTCVKFDADKVIVGSRRHKLLLNFDPHQLSQSYTNQERINKKRPSINFSPEHLTSILCLDFCSTSSAVCQFLATGDSSGTIMLWNTFTGTRLAQVQNAHNGGVSGVMVIDAPWLHGKESGMVVSTGFDGVVKIFEISSPEIPDLESGKKSTKRERYRPLTYREAYFLFSEISQKSLFKDRRPSSLFKQVSLSNVGRKKDTSRTSEKWRKNPFSQGFGFGKRDVDCVDRDLKSSRSERQGKFTFNPLKKNSDSFTTSSPNIRSISSFRDPSNLRAPYRPEPATEAQQPRFLMSKCSESKKCEAAIDEETDSSTKTLLKLKTSWIAHSKDIYCVKTFGDGSRFVTGSLDWSVKIWDTRSGLCKHTLQGHSDSVTCLCIGGQYVFSGSLDGKIKQWDSISGSCVRTIESGHGRIRAMDCYDSWLVTGGWDENVKTWNIPSGTISHEFELKRGPIISVQVSDRIIIVATKGEGMENEITLMDFADYDLSSSNSPPRNEPSKVVNDDPFAWSTLEPKLTTLKRHFHHVMELSEDHTIQNNDEVTDYHNCTEGYGGLGEEGEESDDDGSEITWEDADVETEVFSEDML